MGRTADNQDVARTRGALRLFTVYAVITLVPIAALGVLLARSFSADLRESGMDEASATASALARGVVEPRLSGASLRDGPTAAERTALVQAAGPLLRQGDFLKIRLRDRPGHVVFDTADPNRAPYGPADDEVTEALAGEPVRLITTIDADPVDGGTSRGTRAVEVYTPLHGPNGRTIGALEVYLPYAPIEASINTSIRSMASLLGFGLLALWVVLGLITWSVTRRLRQSAGETSRLARLDPLTGLANRTALTDQLARTLATSPEVPITFAHMDLDAFGEINEVLGHQNGDRFLCHVADEMRTVVGDRGAVARIGGDDFGLVLPRVDRAEALTIIEEIRHALLRPMDLDDVGVTAEVAVGMVVAHGGDDPGEVMRQATVACRAAKQSKYPLMTYSPDLEGFDADRLALVTELRRSLDAEHLVLHYQPKVVARDGRVVGVEALIRWVHPDRGLLMPGAFLPAAESTELIVTLTDWVIDQACSQARTWQLADRALPIAVNVSARCLRDFAFADRVLAALMRHDLPPSLLSIEITETAVIADPARAAATLRRLADRGVHIAVDDFGVGYTSLAHLEQLPIDELKIDRQFVSRLAEDDIKGGAVVRAVVSLGHELGMTVVAEGVEDDATLRELDEMGCDIAQGYGIARPGPVAVLEEWLAARAAAAAASAGTDASAPDEVSSSA